MNEPGRSLLALTLARAAAWSLLLAGWVGIGSLALALAPATWAGFAVVAAWLAALGVAARVAPHDALPRGVRSAALFGCAAAAATAVVASTRGAGLPALAVALLAWAALTALASGSVRELRWMQLTPPGPPIGAASLGAAAAAIALGDIGDLQALTLRLALLVVGVAALLGILQAGATRRAATQPQRCRAGLFDCALPAWPAGAWHDLASWPTLLAGLAMLPMMAALPSMAAWCRSDAVSPQAVVALHLAAMFAPALLLRHRVARWDGRRLATVCAACLAAGALALALPAPASWLGLAAAHGAAWGLAWAGQLWAPERRAGRRASPLRAALGYAVLTLVFGAIVAALGPGAATLTHAVLGGVAVGAAVAACGRPRHRPSEGVH